MRQVLAPCAVGGLQPHLGPGVLVVPDQLVDRTQGRDQTFHDDGAVHVAFGDPYCPDGRAAVAARAEAAAWPLSRTGTLVVIQGPRFSTRAESRSYSAAGWDVIGMTGSPEAVLARELALCYTAVALVTDLDAGVEEGSSVTAAEVFEVFGRNIEKMRSLVADAVAALPTTRTCPCAAALDGQHVRLQLP